MSKAAASPLLPRTAVVYLLRKVNPERCLSNFVSSIMSFRAGADYQPVLLQKGYDADAPADARASAWLSPSGRRPIVINVSDQGFDINAYMKAAPQLDCEQVLFFNSHSRILAPDWMAIFNSASERLGPDAVIGATGSWEISGKARRFPNAHLRTNAFMIRRENFLKLHYKLETKRDCNDFEAGPDSFTRRTLASGGHVAVVDRLGRLTGPAGWCANPVYRIGNQEHLLVGDNRTEDYQVSSRARRKYLAELAWGPQHV